MSVKLVIVALLAAAVTAATTNTDDTNTTTKTDVLSFKNCTPTYADCNCESTATNTKKYTVGQCVAEGSQYWKVDSCTAKVLKGYGEGNNKCEPDYIGFPMGCTAVTYYKAMCDNNTTVMLYAGCNSKDCEKGKGSDETNNDNGCKTSTNFTLSSDADKCKKAGNKYYKLPQNMSTCPTSENTITLMQYNEAECKDQGKAVNISTTCTGAAYQQVTCDANTGVTIKDCSDMACSSCQEESFNLPLKQYKMSKDIGYLYADSCPDMEKDMEKEKKDTETKDNAKVKIEVYPDVKMFKVGCKEHTETTCGSDKKDTTTNGTNTSTNETNTTDNTKDTTKDSTTNSNDSSNNEDATTDSNDTVSTTSDDGIIAPAHTVGVLALALYLLACIY